MERPSLLLPEVAAMYALSGNTVLVHVPRLGRTIDLRTITRAEADQLMTLEGGFDWLVALEAAAEEEEKVLAQAKRKTGARGGE